MGKSVVDIRGLSKVFQRDSFSVAALETIDLVVEEGGIGAGTKVRFEMVMFGKVQQAQSIITEPEPGRVLVESTTDGLAVTRFIVEARDGGRAANVTISTDLKNQGLIGNAIIKFLFKRIYREELALLAEFAARK